jgi:hypothetical protein
MRQQDDTRDVATVSEQFDWVGEVFWGLQGIGRQTGFDCCELSDWRDLLTLLRV